MPSATASAPRRRASAGLRTSGIRWDRLSRVALLALLGAILLMYISPAKHWWESSRTAAAQSEELAHLEAENKRLKQRAALLKDPDTLELEARKLGMTRSDERAFVIENPPRR
ncbi:MAG TPA: septum formation initiator family protein [Thermoleophilaceae bacterium]|nr:septum formation initiator family protein [Thermoleophilaceae bacterium]